MYGGDLGRLQKHQVVKHSIFECLKLVEKLTRLRKMDMRMHRHVQGLLDETVFKLVKAKGCPVQRPRDVVRLQVINELCFFFSKRHSLEQRQRLSMFRIIFLGREDDAEVHECRLNMLAKLVTVSTFLECTPILMDTALWLQEELLFKGQSSSIDTFCKIVAGELFVPNEDDHCCEFVLSLGDLCPPLAIILLLLLIDRSDHFVMLSIPLLESAAEWLTDQQKALFSLLREAGSGKSPFSVSVFDLVSQCMDKLSCLCVTYAVMADGDVSESVALTMSKIRLALLKILQAMPKTPSGGEFTCSLSGRYAGEMLLQVADYRRRRESFDAKVNGALDAFGQIMVAALIGNAFAGRKRDFNMSVCYQLTYGHPLLSYFFSELP